LALLGFAALPEIPGWYAMAPYWLVSLQAAILLVLISLTDWQMERRKLYFSL